MSHIDAYQESEKLSQVRQFEKENHIPFEERPAFHVTPAAGWMNDPNGFSMYKGKAHLFYQYHPYTRKWGPMHWGHQVSDDFIVWNELPAALAPDESYDKDGCFSGTAIETADGHLLVYTGVSKDGKERQQQCAAIGDGINYRKFENNPLIKTEDLPEELDEVNFRDPKIWKEDGKWHLLAGCQDHDSNGKAILFTGEKLDEMKFERYLAESEGKNGAMWECPDYFTLDGKPVLIFSPQDMEGEGLEFHPGHNSVYLLGNQTENGPAMDPLMHQLDYGFDFYAPQSVEAKDGRRIMTAWMSSWHSPAADKDQKWNSQMSLPRELSLKEGRLIQKPVREIENWYSDSVSLKDMTIDSEISFEGIKGRYADLTVSFDGNDYGEFAIDFASNGKNRTSLVLDEKKKIIELDRTYSGMVSDITSLRKAPMPERGVSQIRIILDRNSAEIFINGGEMVLSTVLPYKPDADQIIFKSDKPVTANIDFHQIDAAGIISKKEMPDQA